MNRREARGVNIGFGIVLGVLLLVEVLFGAVDLAPDAGYMVPSYLVWIENISFAESLWIDSLFSLLFLAWIIFSFIERNQLGGRSMRSERGGAAAGMLLLLVAVVLGGAFIYVVFGMNLEEIWTAFKGFLGGL
jgi:hypothetical protein